ncbi:hypothetical protein GCM10017044_19780 [Kordiimonas sediminis]|uniref:PhoD-like phosphatase metallophosphatase domain-containing protein n=1 Tax=Kordiimonas sediminis TaxID=1735581 RepID=A0A919AV55_9PROT|nr:alkaline phosphatase D family protein [Kordiimonas sediminis]GHF25047.1 hypothetical protein GCM10017044_19780 [Kordiimonas sediminis]
MLNRRETLKLLGVTGLASAAASGLASDAASPAVAGDSSAKLQASASGNTVSRILFGSCAHQDKEQPIWGPINALEPDLFIMLGDNIYGDTRDMKLLSSKYQKLADKPGFKELRGRTPLIATWDDHDYGENDAGYDYPMKEQSKELFLDFFEEPEDSPRRRKDDGIYTSYMYGEGDTAVQVILLDLRWNRTPISHVSAKEAKRRDQMGFGPYVPLLDPSSTILGEKQWQWLEAELQKPARLRVIGSSLQFISTFPGWEAWSLFPRERQRLISLIDQTQADGVVFISGDTHWAEISCQTEKCPYPLYDFTSSGLTETWHNMSPNVYRLPGCLYTEANFGVIEIDWTVPDPHIVLQARDVNGRPIFEKSILLSQLAAQR